MTATKITLKDLRTYFTETIYNNLPLKYPQINKNQAAKIFDAELADPNFIPGDLPASVRAECFLFERGGYKYNTTDELSKIMKLKSKYLSLAEKIILAHRKTEHLDTDNVLEIDLRSSAIDLAMKTGGFEFTEYENQLIDIASVQGFWLL